MLTININAIELFDETTKEFVNTEDVTLHLEHSLVSLSKWEATWEKPFLGSKEKTTKETIDYIRCMDLSNDTASEVYYRLTNKHIEEIGKYIDAKMTATWFNEPKPMQGTAASREVITAEIIYYWMIASNIPFECQYWHLNRLLTLIKVCSQKNAPPKKMGRQEIINRNRDLNAARKAQLNTNG